MPKFDWVQPTLEFLSPTFAEFLLFVATLVLFIASWRDLRRALIMTFGGHDARLRTLRILNDIEAQLGGYLLTVTIDQSSASAPRPASSARSPACPIRPASARWPRP